MKKLTLLFALLLWCMTAFAFTHKVARGETLESIAAKYNVTEAQLIEANPGAAKLFYVGLVLNIPESASSPSTQASQPASVPQPNVITHQDLPSYTEVSEERNPNNFSHWYIQYFSDPEYFDKGWYGIGWVTYGESGFGGTMSIHGNWGIVKPGNLMYKLGPAYGCALSQHFMVNASLRGLIYTYDKPSKKNPNSTDQKVNGGITLTPGITLRYEKIMLTAGFEFGWVHNSHDLYKTIEIGLGYNF